MRNFRESRDDRSLFAPRQISTRQAPKIRTCMWTVATPLLIASGQILKPHLTHTKQTGNIFLIASFSALFAVRAASARERVADHQSGNSNRAFSNRNTPEFRKFANPRKQTRNDFLTATNSAMSRNSAQGNHTRAVREPPLPVQINGGRGLPAEGGQAAPLPIQERICDADDGDSFSRMGGAFRGRLLPEHGPRRAGRAPRVTNHDSPITNHAFPSGNPSARLRSFPRSRLREIFQPPRQRFW
jgi:hypothetical protein